MLANLVLLNKLLVVSLRMLSDEIPNGHKSMYESLAQFSAGTAEHKSDGGELFVPPIWPCP